MTKSPSSPPWTTATKAVVAVSALALAVLVIWRFQDLIQPLVLALLLAYLLHPVISLISQRTGLARGTTVPHRLRESGRCADRHPLLCGCHHLSTGGDCGEEPAPLV